MKKDTTKVKIIISSLKGDFKTLRHYFQLIEIEVQCSKNYFKISLSQEAGASKNNTETDPQKSRPKLKNYKY